MNLAKGADDFQMPARCEARQWHDRDEESRDKDEEKSRQDAGGTRWRMRDRLKMRHSKWPSPTTSRIALSENWLKIRNRLTESVTLWKSVARAGTLPSP